MHHLLVVSGRLRRWVVPALVVVIVACATGAIMVGRYEVSLADIVAAFRARLGAGPAVAPRIDSVVFNLRVPRVIVAVLIGAGLSVAGASFQSLFSNPLPPRTPWASPRAPAWERWRRCCSTGTCWACRRWHWRRGW